MLSDFYIPIDINPALIKLDDNTLLSPDVDSDENLSTRSDVEKSMFSIGTNDLCLSHKKSKKSQSRFLLMLTNFIIMFRYKIIE